MARDLGEFGFPYVVMNVKKISFASHDDLNDEIQVRVVCDGAMIILPYASDAKEKAISLYDYLKKSLYENEQPNG